MDYSGRKMARSCSCVSTYICKTLRLVYYGILCLSRFLSATLSILIILVISNTLFTSLIC